MNHLLGVDIAQIVADNISELLLPVTLIESTPGQRDPSNLTGGRRTIETEYSARGFIDDYTDRQVDGTLIQADDRKVTVIGNSIENRYVPSTGAEVIVEDQRYAIIRVTRDPAAAVYELQVRR